ncbi:thiamine phosphate synthase [Raineyella sp.]|uniref:thiamine phosphate synthase n=1 Tax=Raineyella sp. TaxID=1911550 RepID=UPI002B1F2210|nr:thiamine phosphate synthase [Raineyella sp.]MEA5155190.1 hypothetical protein [Raineyella sp.]
MTVLLPVRRRLAMARLWAVLVPSPFTPPEALLRRVEDLLAAGAEVVQVVLDDWEAADALRLLRRCAVTTGALGRLLVTAHDPELAVDLGAEALLLGSEQNLPEDLLGRLGPGAAVGREVADAHQLLEALREEHLAFLVLIGDRAERLARDAHDHGPRVVRDEFADPVTAPLPWFIDLGTDWNAPGSMLAGPCRVRFEVPVPVSSPTDEPSPGLRADVRALAARVEQRWAADPTVARHRVAEWAAASAASRSFLTGATDAVTGATDAVTGTTDPVPGTTG